MAAFFCGCTCQTLPAVDGGVGGGGDGGGGGLVDAGAVADAGLTRCDYDVTAFVTGATGTAHLKRIESTTEFVGGPTAQARIGDYRFDNEKIRLVVQGLGRAFGPQPYGGTILDADLVRPDGGPGEDEFGELGLLYNFGRTVKPERFDIIADGSDGGAAILAVTGFDSANDYLSIRNKLAESLGRPTLADPYVSVPLKVTNYFVLNPGEQRLRFVSALCNLSQTQTVELAVGDLTDPGYTLEYFNSFSCTKGFGFGGVCFGLDRMSWFGYQGTHVAYGYAPYAPGQPTVPEPQNAVLTVAGITGTILGANGISGLVAWINPAPQPREGELRLSPFQIGVVARDFWVADTLGSISSLVETSRAKALSSALGTIGGTVRSGGTPLAGARVTLEGANDGRQVFTTDAAGHWSGTLAAQTYLVSAWAPGRLPTTKKSLQVLESAPVSADFDLVDPRHLTVNARETNGGPLPAKVTVLCLNGPCAVTNRSLVLYADVPKDPRPDNVALIGHLGASGTATFDLPPDQYLVLVSHGPEFSMYPNTYPIDPGVALDVRTADATINAVLAHVVDTTGWVSTDLHVHAVNSPDSIVDNASRVLSFAAEGVDVIVSTDHDFVTDYAPVIAQAGLSQSIGSVIGEEVSPMEFGHYNLFPVVPDATALNGGAIDWAGGEGPTLALPELFATARARGATTIAFNHPRGTLGGLNALKVDTDTFATQTEPESLRMAPQPGATLADTKLMSSDFNSLELLSPSDDGLSGESSSAHARFNDWFTLLSRGVLVAGTGVSDTHVRGLATGWRTWVEVGVDAPSLVTGPLLSARLNAMRALASNGIFMQVRAYRVDGSGAMVTAPVGIGGTLGPDSRELGVQVEVQVPTYLDVTRVELYMHQPEDDTSCPLSPSSPRLATTRVACGGQGNSNWPSSGITATQNVTLGPGDLQTAASEAGITYRRYRKTVTFRLPAPTTDNWVVAMAYGSKSLAPNLYPPPGLNGGVRATAPFAVSNPILIDADGNGYDQAPFRPLVPPHAPPQMRVSVPQAPVSTDPSAIYQRWGEQFGHD